MDATASSAIVAAPSVVVATCGSMVRHCAAPILIHEMCFADDGDTVLRRDQISAAKFMGIIASVAVLTFVSCSGDHSCECQIHRTRELSRGKSALEIARKIRFRERFQADLGCPVAREKIFRFSLSPNQWLCVPCPAFTRGALRDRHERWERDAMDASARKTNAP
jgi:hypothetical protein